MSGFDHLSPHLQQVVKQSEETRWLFVKDLQKDDILVIKTANSTHTMKITDPEKHQVLYKNDSKTIPILEYTSASIGGSTLTGTGTMMKLGGVATGLRLCVFVEDEGEIMLAKAEHIYLNEYEVMQ